MTDQELIRQLKILKNIHPDSAWVDLTRSQFSNINPQITTNTANIFKRIFTLNIPRPLAISAMAAIVAIVGGISFVQNGKDNVGTFAYNTKPLSAETREELKEIASLVSKTVPTIIRSDAGIAASDASERRVYTVVFDEDSDAQESFKDALRNRIEAKISKINDLFAQLEDGDLARDISLNSRRFEESFKIADSELGEQVKVLLADAEDALDDGDLIGALDLVNAIDKLLESD